MILTINGQLVLLHPVIAAMITALVKQQEEIWKRGEGKIELHYAPDRVAFKLYDPPVSTCYEKTVDKMPPPSV